MLQELPDSRLLNYALEVQALVLCGLLGRADPPLGNY